VTAFDAAAFFERYAAAWSAWDHNAIAAMIDLPQTVDYGVFVSRFVTREELDISLGRYFDDWQAHGVAGIDVARLTSHPDENTVGATVEFRLRDPHGGEILRYTITYAVRLVDGDWKIIGSGIADIERAQRAAGWR